MLKTYKISKEEIKKRQIELRFVPLQYIENDDGTITKITVADCPDGAFLRFSTIDKATGKVIGVQFHYDELMHLAQEKDSDDPEIHLVSNVTPYLDNLVESGEAEHTVIRTEFTSVPEPLMDEDDNYVEEHPDTYVEKDDPMNEVRKAHNLPLVDGTMPEEKEDDEPVEDEEEPVKPEDFTLEENDLDEEEDSEAVEHQPNEEDDSYDELDEEEEEPVDVLDEDDETEAGWHQPDSPVKEEVLQSANKRHIDADPRGNSNKKFKKKNKYQKQNYQQQKSANTNIKFPSGVDTSLLDKLFE
jgi:hypothetical protein